MLKALSSELASSTSAESNATKSAALELHNVKERISNLAAGLKTWRDHLNRISKMEAEAAELEAECGRMFEAAIKAIEEDDAEEANPVSSRRRRLNRCQVGGKKS